jgi:hypothetical protein
MTVGVRLARAASPVTSVYPGALLQNGRGLSILAGFPVYNLICSEREVDMYFTTRANRFHNLALLSSLIAFAPHADAQKYPVKPIRMVVLFSAGSGTDVIARFVGPKQYETWGQQVVVDNRGSAGGTVAGTAVATATPIRPAGALSPGASSIPWAEGYRSRDAPARAA